MVEPEPRTRIVYKKPPSTIMLRRVIPHRWSIPIGDSVFGQGLTPNGHTKLREGLGKILRQEHITPGDDIYPIYEDAIRFIVDGQENIPRSGATLFIGNHATSPLLARMVHFIEAARIAHNMRQDVTDSVTREPRVIFQRGIKTAIKLRGRKIGAVTVPFSKPFYHLAANSLNWITVSPPTFDKNGQIVNRQNLPSGVTEEVVEGQALFLFPQGKHNEGLNMPDKNGLITKMRDFDVNTVPVLFEQGNPYHIAFGRPVHIQDFPRNEEGELDVNEFSQKHLAPLRR